MIHSKNIQLWTVKSMYFLSYAGFASWLSLFYVYLKEVNGFSGFQIGVIASLQQVNMMLVLPFWGMMADKFGRKKMFLLALLASVVLFSGFYLTHSFVYYVFFILVFTVFYQPLNSLMDSITLDYIEQYRNTSFGEVRLWASIGWAVSSTVTGQLVDQQNLHVIFMVAATILFLVWLITFLVYRPLKVKRNVAPVKFQTIRRLLALDKRLTLTLVIFLFFGIFTAPTHMFINMYFLDIGGTYQHIGLAYAVQALSELPFFFYGKKIIDRFGIKNALLFTILVSAIRMIGYGTVTVPWFAVVLGAIHGIGFGLFMVAAVDYLHRFVPANMRATGQSFFYVFYFGAGFSLGNMFTGIIKDLLNMPMAMLIYGVLSVGLVLVAFFAIQLPDRDKVAL